MIKNVVFDMGNVLIRYAPADFIKSFTSNPDHQALLLNEIFLSSEWLELDRGTISKHELIKNARERLPETLHVSVSEVMETWFKEMTPIIEMEEILNKLKKNKYHLYLFSNVSQDFHEFKQIIPGIKLFDGLFLSSDWKTIKPEKEIYEKFFAHFDLVPSECFFIDDLAMNIEGAARFGMDGHVFDGNISDLKAHFEKAGINL